MCGITIAIDLVHDTRHLFARSRIDGIKAMYSRGFSGGKQVIKFANSSNAVEFVYSIKRASSDLISPHGQFNNILSSSLPTKKYLDRLPSYYDLDLFTLNTFLDRSSDSNTYYSNTRCKYFSPHSFCDQKSKFATNPYPDSNISFMHTNIRSLKRNLENFQTHLLDELDFHFNIIGVTEAKINSSTENLDFNPSILHYNFEYLQRLFQLEV